jgi:FkbM family methyltransferase
MYTEAGLAYLWEYLLAHQNPPAGLSIDQESLDFLGYCLPRLHLSKAQYFQDLYVTYKMHDKRGGYFVEFGAADGIAMSNTFHLEYDLDWKGVLAEPFPIWHQHLRLNRKAKIDYRCVWRETGSQLEFLAANKYPLLASLKAFATSDFNTESRLMDSETITVKTVSLNDLLREHNAPHTIDYLSVDTEGSELDILTNFDFEKYLVRIMHVEHSMREGYRETIQRLLESKGFIREFPQFSGADDWFFHPDRV